PAGDHAARMNANADRLRLLPLLGVLDQDGDAAVVGDAGTRVNADRRTGAVALGVAVARRVAAPVADVHFLRAQHADGVRSDADGDLLDHLAGRQVDALHAVVARDGDQQLRVGQPSKAGGMRRPLDLPRLENCNAGFPGVVAVLLLAGDA